MALPTQLPDRLLRLLLRHGFAVPALGVGGERDPVALHRTGDDQGGSGAVGGLAVGGVDRGHVVPVDLDRPPSEGPGSGGVLVAVPLQHRGAALAQPVHVQDPDQTARLMERGVRHRFPYGALHDLRVAHQHPHPAGQGVHAHRKRHPQAERQPLSEGTGRDVDPRHLRHRSGMALDG